jgi:glycosyltransferase involved in cell wall biosynthesis
MKQHSISLLVPCFNAGKYIESFIDHIATLNFAEVIFYNDGSTDNTLELLESSGQTFISSPVNNGSGFARNKLANNATCEYIHFHDIDDKFNPGFINLISEQLSQSPDVIVGNADWIIEATGAIEIQWRYNADEANADPLAYFIAHPLGIINTVYKRESFLAAGGFNEKIKCWEDSDLHVTLAGKGNKFAFTDSVLAYSMRHGNGVSSNQNWCWQCRFKFLQGYLAQFPAKYTPVILEEIARCAQAFYDTGLRDDFNKCVSICKQYGLLLPISKNPFINTLKKLSAPPRLAYDLVLGYKKLKGNG